MSPIIITIIGAFLGSAGLFSFITFLINRHDTKHDVLEELKQEHERDVQKLHDERVEADAILRQEREEINAETRELLMEIKEQTLKNEKDNVRTQLLVLMADYPDDTAELMRCAEHYFKDLEGNWYLTPLFAKYLRDRGIVAPEWLLNQHGGV